MTAVTIRGDMRRITRDLKVTQPKLVRAATISALGRTNAKVFTAAKREVRTETGLPLKVFKKRIRKYPVDKRRLSVKTWMGLRGRIKLSDANTGKRINPKWRSLVFEASLEGRELEQAFRATAGASSSIFVRKQSAAGASGRDAKGRPRRGRLPIRVITLDITRPASVAIRRAGERIARPEFDRRLRHEIQRRQQRAR